MKEQLEKIRQEALDALNAVGDSNELESLRVRFLGKKGELTAVPIEARTPQLLPEA